MALASTFCVVGKGAELWEGLQGDWVTTCDSQNGALQKWPSDSGGQGVPACQPLGSPGPHGARVLPGKHSLAPWVPGLHLKPQTEAQSPVLVSACSREGWEAGRCVAAWTHFSGLVGRAGELPAYAALLPGCPATHTELVKSRSPSSRQRVTVFL